MPANYLICTADDLGYSKSRDVGIVQCFVQGIVTRASLLVNGVHAAGAARMAIAAKLPLGLHLNLTEGVPCSKAAASLVQNGFFLGKFETFEAFHDGSVKRQDIQEEVVAQVRKFRELVGCIPRYIDGHNHVHILPAVVEVLREVMCEYSVSEIRIPTSPARFASLKLPVRSEAFLQKVARFAETARAEYMAKGIVGTDSFMGLWLSGKNLTKENIFRVICSTSDSEEAVELMVHPGFLAAPNEAAGCGTGADEFSCSEDRLLELETLCDASVKEMLQHDLGMRFVDSIGMANRERRQLQKRALLLSGLKPATGNATTAIRLRRILNTLGYAVRMLDAPYLRNDDFVALTEDWKPQLCIAIHAIKGGRFLRHLHSMNKTQSQRIIVIGGTDINCHPGDDEIQNNLVAAHLVVCFTESLRRKTAALIPPHASLPIKVIPQSVHIGTLPTFELRAHLGFKHSDKIVILPTGLRPVKDPLYAKDVFLDLQRSAPSLKLVIVGPVLDQEVLEKVERACVESDGAITYMPPVHHTLLLSLIQQANALLNSSKSEGMASTVLEAMALRTLVIARKNEGNSAVIAHKVNGLLFDKPQELEELIRLFVLSASDRTSQLVETAFSDFERCYGFSKEVEMYRSVVSSFEAR